MVKHREVSKYYETDCGSIPTNKQSITSVDLHVFRDASNLAKCAAVYVVVNQPSAISQSRISKRDLTIPRLELVSKHMAYVI